MSFDDCYQLGQVIRTHGLKGELQVFLDVDFPEEYKNLESVFVEINGKLIPFFIQSLLIQKDRVYLKLEEVENVNDAERMVGCALYLPLDNLPELPEGQYYFHQLIGFDVYDGATLIGRVKEIYEMPTTNLLGVDFQGKGMEILVPTEETILLSVDLPARKVQTKLPEGLIDVYLDKK